MATSRAALALVLAAAFMAFASAQTYYSPPVTYPSPAYTYPSPAYTPSPPVYDYDDFVGNWTGVCYSMATTKDLKWSSCLKSPISQPYWASITKEGASYYYTWYLDKTVTYDHDDDSKTYETEGQEQDKTLLEFKVAGDSLCVTAGDISFSWKLEEEYDDKGKVVYKKIYEMDYFPGGDLEKSSCPKNPYQGLFCDSCTYDFNYHCVLEPVYKYTPKCSPPMVYPSPVYYPSPKYSPSPEGYYPSPQYKPSPSPSPYYRKML